VIRAASLLALAALPCAAQTGPVNRPAAATVATEFRVIETENLDSLTSMEESPNGRFILSWGDNSFVIYERATRRKIELPVEGEAAQWSPRGDFIVFERPDDAGVRTHVWVQPIDSVTGMASGAARRVSLVEGGYPAVSPDGREIAFLSRSGDVARLLAIPSRGGPARTVATFPNQNSGPMRPSWTRDGRWIYFSTQGPASWGNIWRVPAGGGEREIIQQGTFRGLSPDGRYMAYFPNRMAYAVEGAPLAIATLDGTEVARISMPRSAYWPSWSASGHRILVPRLDLPEGTFTIDLASGRATSLTPWSSYLHRPIFSPDGRRIAAVRRGEGPNRVVLLDPSGRVLREFASAAVQSTLEWSPDGSRLAYLAGLLPFALHVLDANTGRVDVLAENLPRTTPPFWRPDGRALRLIEGAREGPLLLVELGLDRSRAVLRSLPEPGTLAMPGGFQLLGDTAVAVFTASRAYIADVRGADVKTIHEVPDSTISGGAVSPDGRHVAVAHWGADGGSIRLFPLPAGPMRTLPFRLGCALNVQWHGPDHLLADGLETCSTRWAFFLVPVSGGAVRRLTDGVPGVDLYTPSIAPDGRSIVFSSEEGWFSHFLEVDLNGVLQRLARP
jgi:Tol biopolymer transport system component